MPGGYVRYAVGARPSWSILLVVCAVSAEWMGTAYIAGEVVSKAAGAARTRHCFGCEARDYQLRSALNNKTYQSIATELEGYKDASTYL